MRFTIKRAVGTLLAAAMLTSLFACGSTQDTQSSSSAADKGSAASEEASTNKTTSGGTLSIAYVGSGVNFPNDLLGIAIDQGYLDEELGEIGWTYESNSFAGGNLVNESLISGEAQIGVLGDVPAMSSKIKGANTTLLAGEVYANDAALVVAPDSDIKTIQDLKGKVVATLEGSFMHKVLMNMLDDNGMSMDDIQFTNMQSADAAAAVETGAVDAALLSEVQYSVAATNNEIKVILSGSDKNEWRGSTSIVVDSDFLAENRAVAVAFMTAYAKAYDYAINNYDAAITCLAQSGMSEEALKFRFPDTVEYNLRADDQLVTAMEGVQKFLQDAQISDAQVDLDTWIDSSVLEEAQDSLKS
ncbi:MAG: ABC transporter substrate-binding protein [Eubacteriales bacterium]|nr:ABC transporter substrate-binding protein [Eubacteriales bacterium]